MKTSLTADVEVKTIRDLIDWMAGKSPGSPFLISPETGRSLTFLQLREQSRLLAERFRQAGWTPGDKIAFLMDNGLFTAQLFLGAMYAGFVSVPLNLRAGVSQLAYSLDHSDAKAVFVGESYGGLLKDVMAHVRRAVQVIRIENDDWSGPDTTPLPEISLRPLQGEDAALLMYTSGSTGQPRAALHTHRSLLAHGRNSVCSHQLTSADRSLLVLPLYHINAECVTLMPTLMSGGSVIVPAHFSVSRFWDWLEDYRCTWSALVPTIISQLLDWKDPKAGNRKETFERIRFLRSSSAPLSPSLHREFLDKFKLPLIQAMGCTEGGNVFSNPVPPGQNKIGSPGLPWGFETRIVNREGVDLAAGEPGEVLLRGPAMMQGYYKDSVATAAALDADGWFHTGDLAYRDEDGYFFVVGRSKELIIKGGMNIAPKQIDEVLESHPAVLEAAAVGVPDRYVGEDLVAFVVFRAGMNCEERELLTFCENRLGHFKTPTRIYFVNDLPKGPSGKVQRLRLVEEAARPAFAKSASLASGSETSSGDGATRQRSSPAVDLPIEQIIAEIWAELLKEPKIDETSNFFALGGHSLLAIQYLSKLRAKIPVILSLSDFFENATVAGQAALVRSRLTVIPTEANAESGGQTPADSESIPPRDRTQPCPLSPAQKRIWFFEQLMPGVPLYNESEAVRLKGDLNVEALERALNVVIARHEILRSTIEGSREEPVVIVHESWPLQFKKVDLSALDATQRQAEVERLLTEEPRLPYHLAAEPGIRATLIHVGPREHVLILMMHHLVCDWSSEGELWREMSAAYRAFLRGEPTTFAPLPIQHGDYAAWLQRQVTETSFATDLAFWEENLRGAPELLELPTDRPRPPALSYRGARRRFRLDTPLSESLRQCSRREKVSLFTVFAAALDTLLYRYTGQEDILLGLPLADRERPELQSMIGFLLHTHVLRTKLAGEMSFRDLLHLVQKGVLDLYSHSAVPFDQVVKKLDPERNFSYTPLFQVMLNWRDRDQLLSFIGMDGLAVESLLAESRTSKFDLTLMLTDDGEAVWLEVEYSTDLFDDERIARLAGHYRTLLEGVASSPERRLSDLPLLPEGERRQILIDWNRTEVAYPERMRLHQLVEEQVNRTPEAEALVFEDKRLTYRELNSRSNQLARRLQRLGVGPDVLVGVCAERSVEMIIGLLAVLKAGGAYLPLDPRYPRERLEFTLEDAAVPVLLTQERLIASLPKHQSQVLRLDSDWRDIAKEKEEDVSSKGDAKSLAYVLYTSGSTGKPKGVALEHGGAVALVSWARTVFSAEELSGVLASTSVCFDLSVFEMFVPLSCGGKVILAENALALPGLPAAEEVSLINTVPSAIAELLRVKGVPASVRVVNLAGEPLPTNLVDQIYRETGAKKVYDLYGPTETTTYSTFTLRKAGEPATIGRPLANEKVYILDKHLQPVPAGIAGDLYIGGAGLARGYLNRPELTSERFVANPFAPGERLYKTGDLASWRDDGNLVYLGRSDNQVKLRGFRIELGEIETLLAQQPGIKSAVVIAREDTPGARRLVAYLVFKNTVIEATELRELLRAKVPDYMVPSVFVKLEALPLTPNGKVDRKALPKPEFESPSDKIELPGTPAEIALAKIWREILGVERIGLHDNFFDLGGHSLLAVRVISRLRTSFQVELPLRKLFEAPTVALLAEQVDLLRWATLSQSEQRLRNPITGQQGVLIEESL